MYKIYSVEKQKSMLGILDMMESLLQNSSSPSLTNINYLSVITYCNLLVILQDLRAVYMADWWVYTRTMWPPDGTAHPNCCWGGYCWTKEWLNYSDSDEIICRYVYLFDWCTDLIMSSPGLPMVRRQTSGPSGAFWES